MRFQILDALAILGILLLVLGLNIATKKQQKTPTQSQASAIYSISKG